MRDKAGLVRRRGVLGTQPLVLSTLADYSGRYERVATCEACYRSGVVLDIGRPQGPLRGGDDGGRRAAAARVQRTESIAPDAFLTID